MGSDTTTVVLVHEDRRAVQGLYAERLAATDDTGPHRAMVVRAEPRHDRSTSFPGRLGCVPDRLARVRSTVSTIADVCGGTPDRSRERAGAVEHDRENHGAR